MKKIVILSVLTIVMLYACQTQQRALESDARLHNEDINSDSILRDSSKIKTFNHRLNAMWGYVPGGAKDVFIDGIAREEKVKDIGMYIYRLRGAHYIFSKDYFLNYIDSIRFISPHDTLSWNKNIKKFIKTYQNVLSEPTKDTLERQYIK